MPKTHPRKYRIEALILNALAPMVAGAAAGAGGAGGALVTLRHVSLNRDFSVATVVYGAVGDDAAQTQTALEQSAWRWRRQLAASLNMRKTPQLVFAPDAQGLAADNMRAFLESIDAAPAAPDNNER